MFKKIQFAATAAILASSALAYTPEAVLVTVTVTNTKTWCPCESTGLASWGQWSTTAHPWSSTPTQSGWGGWNTADSTATTWSGTPTYSYSSPTGNRTSTTGLPTPTPQPGCSLVEWIPGTCQDDSYFKVGDDYLYQSCDRVLIDTPNYLEDQIEAFCDVTSLFDDSFKATAWDPESERCYVYDDADDIFPSSFRDSKIVAAGNVDYTIKFDSNPCSN